MEEKSFPLLSEFGAMTRARYNNKIVPDNPQALCIDSLLWTKQLFSVKTFDTNKVTLQRHLETT